MKYVLLVVAFALVPSMAFATADFAKKYPGGLKCNDCHGASKKVDGLTEKGKASLEEFCKQNPTKEYCKK